MTCLLLFMPRKQLVQVTHKLIEAAKKVEFKTTDLKFNTCTCKQTIERNETTYTARKYRKIRLGQCKMERIMLELFKHVTGIIANQR